MTIRFAAARGRPSPLARRVLCASASLDAVNDNEAEHSTLARRPARPDEERSLIDALRHFSRHGLAAAACARDQAIAAHVQNDDTGYRRWLDICRHLDRRMASGLAHTLEFEAS